jgi:hypothetical protein
MIGCNSSGTVDGTRYVIDCNSNGINGIDFAGNDMWWLQNIEVKNTGGSGKAGFYCSTGTASGCVFINCCGNNAAYAFKNSLITYSYFIQCVGYSCTNGFYQTANYNKLIFVVEEIIQEQDLQNLGYGTHL